VDGKTIIARRPAGKSTKYVINGKEFAKLAAQIPAELSAFGMNEVEVGEFTIDPIFSRQNGKQFLVDPEGYSPMELNTILGAFASTEKLEAGKKAANLEITHKNSEAKTLAEEVNTAESRKASLTNLAQNTSRVATSLQSLKPEIEALESKKTWVEAARARQAVLWPLQAAVAKLAVPDLTEVERLTKGRQLAIQATNSFRVARLCQKVKEALETVNQTWDAAKTYYQQIQAVEDYYALKSQVFLPVLDVVGAKIETAKAGFAMAKSYTDGIILLAQIQTYADRALSVAHEVRTTELLIENLNVQVAEVKSQMAESQKIECPKCGERFEPEVSNARTA
jgi:hypothetical protein